MNERQYYMHDIQLNCWIGSDVQLGGGMVHDTWHGCMDNEMKEITLYNR